MTDRIGVDDLPASDGLAGRRPANDESVTLEHRDWFVKSHLHPAHIAGNELFPIEQREPTRCLCRTCKEIDLVILS